MTKKEFYEQLENILEMPAGSITGSEQLEELASWDSLAMVSFVAMADERLGATPGAERVQKSTSVADLVALMGDKIRG